MIRVLLVAAGGAAGSVLRFLVGLGFAEAGLARLPAATLTVNAVGSFAIGLVMAAWPVSVARDAVTIGVLGGFTTYSAFAFETVELWGHDRRAVAAGYVVATLSVGLLAAALGIAAGRRLAA
jgi:CrcB protein